MEVQVLVFRSKMDKNLVSLVTNGITDVTVLSMMVLMEFNTKNKLKVILLDQNVFALNVVPSMTNIRIQEP